MILALGVVMALLGEVFRRNGSVVFAGSLTFGGIVDLFICSFVGRFVFDVIIDGALIIGALAAVVGFALSVRYKSQALLIVTLVSSFIPTWAIDSSVGFFISAVFLTSIHATTAIIGQHCWAFPLLMLSLRNG